MAVPIHCSKHHSSTNENILLNNSSFVSTVNLDNKNPFYHNHNKSQAPTWPLLFLSVLDCLYTNNNH